MKELNHFNYQALLTKIDNSKPMQLIALSKQLIKLTDSVIGSNNQKDIDTAFFAFTAINKSKERLEQISKKHFTIDMNTDISNLLNQFSRNLIKFKEFEVPFEKAFEIFFNKTLTINYLEDIQTVNKILEYFYKNGLKPPKLNYSINTVYMSNLSLSNRAQLVLRWCERNMSKDSAIFKVLPSKRDSIDLHKYRVFKDIEMFADLIKSLKEEEDEENRQRTN